MTQGYERGVAAAKFESVFATPSIGNPYPEWCHEYERFEAGLNGEPDPDLPSQPSLL